MMPAFLAKHYPQGPLIVAANGATVCNRQSVLKFKLKNKLRILTVVHFFSHSKKAFCVSTGRCFPVISNGHKPSKNLLSWPTNASGTCGTNLFLLISLLKDPYKVVGFPCYHALRGVTFVTTFSVEFQSIRNIVSKHLPVLYSDSIMMSSCSLNVKFGRYLCYSPRSKSPLGCQSFSKIRLPYLVP